MICKCKYNPVTDLKQVSPGLSIDVIECLSTGTVLPAAKESFSNALDDIRKVGKRVRDVFDALEAQGMIAKVCLLRMKLTRLKLASVRAIT